MASRPMGVPGAIGGVVGGVPVAVAAPGMVNTGGPPASQGKNTNQTALQEIEEAYNKRLDMDIIQLTESFKDIIHVASINYPNTTLAKDKYKIAQESYQIQGRATNIVSSAESLLAMVTELKQTLLLNDTTTLAQLSTDRQKELTLKKTAVKQRVLGLKEEVDRTIWALEKECYGTLDPGMAAQSSSLPQTAESFSVDTTSANTNGVNGATS